MRGRRVAYLAALIAVAAALVVVGIGLAGGGGEVVPTTPIPRVCWYSDYEHAKLSNGCEYNAREGRWYKEVDGRLVPADGLALPVANLCHYFHGQECPTGTGAR